MQAQQKVSEEIMAARIGRTVHVLIDEVDEDGAVGRSEWDAPEIDGSVILEGAVDLKPGDMIAARITDADAYDLWAEPAPRT